LTQREAIWGAIVTKDSQLIDCLGIKPADEKMWISAATNLYRIVSKDVHNNKNSGVVIMPRLQGANESKLAEAICICTPIRYTII
jgi:hypothetical protein